MVINWVSHNKLQGGKYPERNSTKIVKIEAGTIGKVVDSSFSKDNLLQLVIDFDGKEVIVPYFMVNILFPEMKK